MPMLHDGGGGVELRVGHEVLSHEAVVLVVGGMDDSGMTRPSALSQNRSASAQIRRATRPRRPGVRREWMWPGRAMCLGVEHVPCQSLDLRRVAVLDQLGHHLAFDPVVLVELGCRRLPELGQAR